MKTLSPKSLMMRHVKLHSPLDSLCISLCLAVLPLSAHAQESWSDSVPRVMKLTRSCPLKVRDKNGEWANFKDSLPAGRNVVGAINPRRPDLVFFQLSRDSRFMFAAARSCFEGEENWNILLEEEHVEGKSNLRSKHFYLLSGISYRRTESEGSTESIGASATMVDYSLGAAAETLRYRNWYFGGGAFAGWGRIKVAVKDGSFAYEDTVSYYTLTGYGSAYYDFISLPYAMGAEPYVSYAKAQAEVSQDGEFSESTSGFGTTFGLALAWRFYWEEVTITPKIVFEKFLPSKVGYQIQIAYLFGGR